MENYKLIPFANDDFGKIRALLIDGEPFFVGKDIATALGYTNPRKALKDHVDDEDKKNGVTVRDSIGRNQTPVLINESGLYSLIFGSKLDTAKKFKRWVTSDVLPSIRKTGSYHLHNHDPRWIETRQLGKKTRKLLTTAIKALEDYFQTKEKIYPQGFLYGHITNTIQNALGIKKGARDFLSVKKLNQLDQSEDIAGNVILKNIADKNLFSLAEIDAQILLQLKQLNSLLSGQLFLPV